MANIILMLNTIIVVIHGHIKVLSNLGPITAFSTISESEIK